MITQMKQKKNPCDTLHKCMHVRAHTHILQDGLRLKIKKKKQDMKIFFKYKNVHIQNQCIGDFLLKNTNYE